MLAAVLFLTRKWVKQQHKTVLFSIATIHIFIRQCINDCSSTKTHVAVRAVDMHNYVMNIFMIPACAILVEEWLEKICMSKCILFVRQK